MPTLNELPPSSGAVPGQASPSGLPAIFLLDGVGTITFASHEASRIWSTQESLLVGRRFPELFVFEVVSSGPEWLQAQWEVILAANLNQVVPLVVQSLDGQTPEVQVRLERHESTGFLAIVQLPVSATRPSDELDAGFKLLADQGAAGFFDLNLQTGVVIYSAAWKRLLGYVGSELPDTLDTWRQLIHPDDSAAAPDQLGKKHSVGSRPFSVEFRMRHRHGHWVWIQCVGLQVLSPAGMLERVVGLHLDVSERKELEETSLANDERFEVLAGSGPLGAFDLDFTNQVFWFSAAWKKLLGYRDDELSDSLATFSSTLPPDELSGGIETWLLLRAPGAINFIEQVELIGKNGQRTPILFGAHRTLTRKRELARVVGFICPALKNPAGHEAPAGLNDPLVRDAFLALAEAILVTDAEGKILFVNATASRLLALKPEQLVEQPVSEVFRLIDRESGRPADDPCDRAISADAPLPLFSSDALSSLLEGVPPRPVVWTSRASLDAAGRPRGVVIVFRDPSEMSLTPEELVKANRFESLGLLAGGIAHDFNNLLTTILGGISLAKDNRDYSALEDSEKACLNAKGLTRQLLMFAKGGSGTQSVIAAKEILDDAIKIASAGSDAEIVVTVPDGVEPVSVDRAQILQVFQNLVVNALQAMPPPPHRARLQLKAGNIALSADQIPPLPAGHYVEFEVRDNGAGIPAENLQKIFDPFFTTKKHGTGLGLATVLSIVRKHGGQIGVDSAMGAGTAFTVFLPRANAPVEVQARKAPSLRFGTGRILFMDDDPNISALTAIMLESLDYKFDLAKDGEEAIQLYKRYLNIGRPYDALVVDITVLGGMGGEECFKAIRDLDPEVRAIVSSGYDNEDMARQFLDMGFCGYLTKPYRVADLGKVLKTVLG
jgi:two-component system cell cycle sensor histidine kinase/response regulator CckA